LTEKVWKIIGINGDKNRKESSSKEDKAAKTIRRPKVGR
jgi:hypothetical protein